MSQRNRKRGRRAYHKPATPGIPPASGRKNSGPSKPRSGGARPRQRWFYDVRQYVLLQDDTGQLLVLQLPADYDTGTANTWTLPGGKLEPADEPLAGIKREIAEETGFTVSVLRPVTVTRWTNRNSKKLAIFYQAAIPGTAPKPTLSAEHQRAVWIKPSELSGFPFHRPEMLETIQNILI